jgi:hypothetical protein
MDHYEPVEDPPTDDTRVGRTAACYAEGRIWTTIGLLLALAA